MINFVLPGPCPRLQDATVPEDLHLLKSLGYALTAKFLRPMVADEEFHSLQPQMSVEAARSVGEAIVNYALAHDIDVICIGQRGISPVVHALMSVVGKVRAGWPARDLGRCAPFRGHVHPRARRVHDSRMHVHS